MPIQFLEEGGQNLGGYPVLLIVDTQTPIAAGQMEADGRDIRFADSCGAQLLPHWIESNLNTDSTRIWVRIPGLSASDSINYFLYHGLPTATSTASFNSVFNSSFTSQGNQNISGPQNFDWFEVRAGDTLFIQAGMPLTVFARRVRIDGVVMGNGMGHAGPGLGQAGNGPGAGATSFNAGAGGGGYGGAGGTGGYDFADTPGTGGGSYGTAIGPDVDMGSSGGSSDNRFGGAGGGSFAAYAEAVDITGGVWCNGMDGEQSAATKGAGGGSGGGILIKGKYLDLTGTLAANGGDGTAGVSPANDDGGGGGGGRIKLFWERSLLDLGQNSALGGLGGPNGTQAPGQDGLEGIVQDSSQSFPTVLATAGPSTTSSLPQNPSLIPIPNPICPGEPVAFSLPSGYANYLFLLNGTPAQDSSLSTWSPGILPDGSTVNVEASFGTCLIKDTLVIQSIATDPVQITASDSSGCIGDTIHLDAGPNWTSVLWSNGDTTQVTHVTFSGFFSVVAIDSNACPVRDTFVVNLGPPPIPQINVSGLPACEGDPITLSTGAFDDYLWSNGGTSQTTVVNASGTYTVTVTAANGCQNDASIPITLDTLPSPTILWFNDTLFTEMGYGSYQWLWNGSPLTGANSYFHVPAFNGSYSVLVTGANGCEGQSDTSIVMVSQTASIPHAEITLYPNPSQGPVQLKLHLPYPATIELSLVDALGRIHWSETEEMGAGENHLAYDFGRITPGVYWVEIRYSEDGRRVQAGKLMLK